MEQVEWNRNARQVAQVPGEVSRVSHPFHSFIVKWVRDPRLRPPPRESFFSPSPVPQVVLGP